MAYDTTLITGDNIVGAALETTSGAAAAVNAAACGIFNVVHNPALRPTINPNMRQMQGSLSKRKQSPGARMGKFTGQTEGFGSGTGGTAPAWALRFLVACGTKQSGGVFTPVTYDAVNLQNTITIGMYQGNGGRFKSIAGCAGTFKLRGVYGQPLMFDWDMTGVWQSPTAAAFPVSITYPTQIPPVFEGATISTMGGVSIRISEFEFDAGCKVYLRPDPTSTDGVRGTGYRAAIVVDRVPVFKIDPESLPLGSLDFFAAHSTGTTYSFSLALGPSGNSITFAAPAAQLLNPPDDKDRDGVLADDLAFLCTSSAGDDEWTLTF